ncbi:MAG: hypothetical protein AAF519_06905 [Bacteroidota bacterium]
MQLRLSVRSILTALCSFLVLTVISLLISSCSDDDTDPPPVQELIRFTLVNPEGDSIVIRNFGTTEIDISDYQLCLGPNQYNAISNYADVVGDLSLSTNETVTIKLGSGTQNVTSLPIENGGLGLFASAEDFSSSDSTLLLDYVQWGAANQNRVNQAVTAGRWGDAADFISGFAPYIFSGTADQVGATFWQTLAPEDARLKTGFILIAETPNGDIITKYFSEFPSGTADLTTGAQVFGAFEPHDVFDGYIFTSGATNGTGGIGRARVNGNGEIVDDGNLAVTGTNRTPKIVDATTGIYTTQASPAQVGIFNPLTMQLEGLIDMSDEGLPGPQRMRGFLIRGDEIFTHIVSLTRNEVPFTSFYFQSANWKTGQFTATAEFPGRPLVNWGTTPLANSVDENGNIYLMASGNLPSLSTIATLHKIPAGSNDFDLDYNFTPSLQVNPTNLLLPFSFSFNYIGNDLAVAFSVTSIPQSVLDLIESVGGDPRDLSEQQFLIALGLFNQEDSGNWVKINVETRETEIIAGMPGQGGLGTAVSVVINDEVYLSISKASENAFYRYDPVTGAVERAFDVVGGGTILGLIDLSE